MNSHPVPATARNPEVARELNGALVVSTTLRGLISRFGEDLVTSTLRAMKARAGKVGWNSPDTSVGASRLQFASQRHDCLARVGVSESTGSTAAAVAQHVGLTRNQTATRLGELHEWGLLEYRVDPDTGKTLTRQVGPNTRGRIHYITPLGQATLLRLTEENPKP